MASTSEVNQFKRLVGDYGKDAVDETVIDEYLDDAARERSADDPLLLPVAEFDLIPATRKPEVVLIAGINWWWDYAGKQAEKHSQNVGQASQQAGERWNRAMEMIRVLTERMAIIREGAAGLIQEGNHSRFSKWSLRRIGGQSEEKSLE